MNCFSVFFFFFCVCMMILKEGFGFWCCLLHMLFCRFRGFWQFQFLISPYFSPFKLMLFSSARQWLNLKECNTNDFSGLCMSSCSILETIREGFASMEYCLILQKTKVDSIYICYSIVVQFSRGSWKRGHDQGFDSNFQAIYI